MDPCTHCIHKGNLDSCRNEDCGFHILWFHLADKEAALESQREKWRDNKRDREEKEMQRYSIAESITGNYAALVKDDNGDFALYTEALADKEAAVKALALKMDAHVAKKDKQITTLTAENKRQAEEMGKDDPFATKKAAVEEGPSAKSSKQIRTAENEILVKEISLNADLRLENERLREEIEKIYNTWPWIKDALKQGKEAGDE